MLYTSSTCKGMILFPHHQVFCQLFDVFAIVQLEIVLLLSSIIQSLFSTRKLLDACGLAEGIA